ncbi:MAG TPA: PAS domain-containing protein [Nodosilinea sp.]|nr:PAS domain-containing protein [Nodosilinea sp.]
MLLLLDDGLEAAAPCPYHLVEAATLAEALDLWQAGRADWALIDLTWAEGGGLGFLTALGKTCSQRPLPVVVLVGPGQERAALEAMKLGAADYLFKAEISLDWLSLGRRLPLSQTALAAQCQTTIALEQARQHYQNLVENSPDVVERFDCNLRHLYVSPALTGMTGADTRAFLGKTCRELGLDESMVDAWEAAAAAVLATGEKQTIEFTSPTLAGLRHFEMAIVPEWSEGGQIQSLLCISRDISDRIAAKQVQAELLQAAQTAQAEASKAHALLTNVFERINDGIVALDSHERFTYVNQRAAQIFRRSESELLGQTLHQAFPEALDQPFYQAYRQAVAQQQPVYLEHYYSPYQRWFESRIYPSADGTTLYFTDITDRKTAEISQQRTEQLRHELLLLEQTLESILAGYWEIDFAANTAYMSANLKRMFGYADHELPDRPDTWQTLIFPEDLPQVLDDLGQHIQSHGEVPYYNEVRYRHKDGSTVWVICAGQVIDWNEAGHPLRMVGCHVDITQLKQTEAQLRKNEAHLQESQRIGNLGSWEMELATGHITWSDQVYRIFGLTVGEQPPSYEVLQSYFHPDDQARHRQTTERAIATHQPYDEEFRIVRVDGSIGHIQAKGEAITDAAGQLTHLTGTVQDISDRKRDEAERKQAEAQLQSLSLRLSLALESGRIGSWERDLSTDEIIWDQYLVELYGFGRLGRSANYQDWRACVFADDLERVQTASQALVDHDTPYDLEFRVWRGDGSLGWIRSSALVQRDAQGQARSVIGINYDITEKKQVAAELQALSARLSLALESGGFGSWEWEIGPDTLNWDQRMIDLYDLAHRGRPSTYSDWLSQVHQDDIETVEATIQTCLENDVPYEVEFRIYRSNGEIRWLKSTALLHRCPQGQPLSMVGINYDITEKKQAETQLQELSLRLSLALESGELGTWELDLATEQVDWDQRMYAMYGLAPKGEALTRQAWRHCVYSEDVAGIDSEFAQIVAGAPPSAIEFRIHRGDGELRWIRATALVQCDGHGQPLCLIGTNADITETKRAERHLLRTTAQLEASNRELEAFAYSVSHDLRAPLRAIDGFSRALIEDYGDQVGDEGHDYFDRIRHNVNRMGRLIDDLLRLSRVSRSAMAYGAVNLSALVQEQIDELRATDPDRTVTVTLAPDLIVSADTTLMRVAIANLVQNAWKFTAHHPTAHLEFGVQMQGADPVYYLRDDGAGFDMAYADKLFGVFQRLHNTHEFPGTGIGLATVQRAIHRQGGQVWAVGAVEQGATIYFTLPQFPPGPEEEL